MSQMPPNVTISSIQSGSKPKTFTVTKVEEPSSDLVIRKPRSNFFYLIQLTTDVKFSSELKNKKSSRFIALAVNVEGEVRLIFNAQCKLVDVKSCGIFNKKSLTILTVASENAISEKIARENLENFLKKEGKNCLFKFYGLKFQVLTKEMFAHYIRFGKSLCDNCSKLKTPISSQQPN